MADDLTDDTPDSTTETAGNATVNPPSEAAAASPSKAKPSSAADRLAALKKRQDQLKAQIAAIEAREKADERKKDARRKIVIGAAVMAHAAIDPEFARELRRVLRLAVTRDFDKAAIEDFLA
jgi:hypothetical protein